MPDTVCRKCRKPIPDGSKFCNHCGTKQNISEVPKSRGNGQGTVYKDKNGKWTAEVTLGYDELDGKLKRATRKKKGFPTKTAALAYLPQLRVDIPVQDANIKFKDLYSKWLKQHEQKVGKSTINCYKAAYKYFNSLYYAEITKIRTEHLQKCIDECPYGTRTRENMKALATCLWRLAVQQDIVDRNYAEFIYIKKEKKDEKTFFTDKQLEIMWKNVEKVPNIKYVLVLCYTGMRVGEMFKAKTKDYNKNEQYFITGSKTEAGKDRIITISPLILPFFDDFGKGEYLFFDGNKTVSDKKFRNDLFYSSLQAVGLDEILPNGDHKFTPHCCRHTFATLMKDIDAPDTDKQKLIGHSNFEMTAHYTHTDIKSLKKITDNIGQSAKNNPPNS